MKVQDAEWSCRYPVNPMICLAYLWLAMLIYKRGVGMCTCLEHNALSRNMKKARGKESKDSKAVSDWPLHSKEEWLFHS